ncbi:UNVERIFIED_CONTAM: hypothetical protein GTU68_034610 [Idotea baltica]|nr:hypothetical protein [Idotea baltica]
MGQKTNPIGNRLGIIRGWESNWYGGDDYGDKLAEDDKIRKYIHVRLAKASVSRVIIERTLKLITVTVTTARPGIIIGKGGQEVDKLKEELKKITNKEVQINIYEIKRPEVDANLVAASVARQIESRISFRRAIKMAIAAAMRMNAEGIKIQISGRLNGAEMARSESYKDGRIPLSTFRADIDYALHEAHTTYGRLGIKVWIMKGVMLQPKRTKFRKMQKGRMKGNSGRGHQLSNGMFGMKSLEGAFLTSRQIEAARIAATRFMKREGQLWIKVFPDKPITKKPLEVRMGKGKGAPEYFVAVVKPGRVVFEIAGVPIDVAKEALRLAAQKLPVKTKFIVARDYSIQD